MLEHVCKALCDIWKGSKTKVLVLKHYPLTSEDQSSNPTASKEDIQITLIPMEMKQHPVHL